MTSPRKRAGLYLRISLDREGKALGVDRQEQACRDLCARDGLDVVAVYADNDRSASRYASKRRPQYAALLAAAHAGKLDVIVAYSSSRLTRKLRDALDLIDLAETGQVEIRTVVSGRYDLATASGRSMAKIAAVFDEQESEVNSERSKAERAQRRERGLPNGGPRPFGWRKDGITPHPEEMPALVRGVRDAIAGRPVKAIARDWSALRDATVSTSTVRRVLLSERIRGRLPDGRPAVWDAVVTDEEAAALRGVLNRPAPRQNAVQLLTGWAVCGTCSATVRGAVNRLGVGCYECSASPHLRVPRGPRDEFVRDLVAGWLDRQHLAAAVDTEPLHTRLAAIGAQLDEVADMLSEGELDRPQAARATDRLRAQRAEVEAQLADIAVRESAPATGAQFLRLDTEGQRRVLGLLPWRVVLDSPGRGKRTFEPESVSVVPHHPTTIR